jgi:murein DD-endopeptidase MepM/ murein hydrolase activator NlpD
VPATTGRPPLAAAAGEGGPYWPLASPSLAQLDAASTPSPPTPTSAPTSSTLAESRLLESPAACPDAAERGAGRGAGRLRIRLSHRPLHRARRAAHRLDFPAAAGTPIEAAAGGVVRAAEAHPAYGLMVEIDHGNALVTRYAHASRLLVRAGDIVRRGQPVATVGSTGRSTGPHLHFEVLLAACRRTRRASSPATARHASRPDDPTGLRHWP